MNTIDTDSGTKLGSLPIVCITVGNTSRCCGGLVSAAAVFSAIWILLSAAGCAKWNLPDKENSDRGQTESLPAISKPVNWKQKGILLTGKEKFEAAIEAFENHVVQQPEDFFGFNAIGVCYKKIGDFPRALKNYHRAMELAVTKEQRAKILTNIGSVYFAAGKPQAALGYYQEATSIEPANPLYLILIARAYINQGAYDRARKVLGQAEKVLGNLKQKERAGDRGFGYYHMGYWYLGLGKSEKALKYIDYALRENPAKYLKKIDQGLEDRKSLFYTLRDDPRLKQTMKRYSSKTSPSHWLDVEWNP